MKKFFLAFAFLGLFTFMTPKTADAVENDCVVDLLICCDATVYYVVVCGNHFERIVDYWTWQDLLCTGCTY